VVATLFQDRGGVMWVGTFGGGVNRYAPYANKFKRYIQRPGDLSGLSDSTVFAISQTPDGTVWIGTLSGGLNRLERESGRMRYYYHLATQPQSIASNDIRALFTDHDGTLWIGTANAGIDQFDPLTNSFLHLQIDPQNPNLTAQYAITTFF
jgi:ligand-binding sensor domain-containing protein